MGDKYTEFVKTISPSLFRRLKKAGVKNVDAAHDYMLRQLAFESGWGNSAVAKKYNNYAGWGHKVVDGKHVYSQFKDSEDFLDTWVPGMLSRYRSAIDAPTLNDYATNLKKKGYYEDSLEHYMQTLNGMGRATRAAAALRQSNPELYTDVEFGIPVRNFAMLNKPYVQPADNTRVVKPTQIQYNKTLPDTEVIGHGRKALQAPAIASLWDTQRQTIEYNLLKAAGFDLDIPSWEQYTPSYKSLIVPQHYEDGAEGTYVGNPYQYYEDAAQQERNRQWNIAKAYMRTPSIPNVVKAIGAAWKALPFNTTAFTVNPNVVYGEAPTVGPIKPLSTFEKLSIAGKVQNAKSLITRRANAAARKAAEQRAKQELQENLANITTYVRDPYKNYVANEAERAAAIDFLKENPNMRNDINLDVLNKYNTDDYMYPWNATFRRLLPTRKPLKQTKLDLDKELKNIR